MFLQQVSRWTMYVRVQNIELIMILKVASERNTDRDVASSIHVRTHVHNIGLWKIIMAKMIFKMVGKEVMHVIRRLSPRDRINTKSTYLLDKMVLLGAEKKSSSFRAGGEASLTPTPYHHHNNILLLTSPQIFVPANVNTIATPIVFCVKKRSQVKGVELSWC